MKIKQYIWQAPIGLIFIGAGLSMAIEAGNLKANHHEWFWLGTFSLIIFNSGLCIFGDAIVKRIRELN
jgi:hypothetical protein